MVNVGKGRKEKRIKNRGGGTWGEGRRKERGRKEGKGELEAKVGEKKEQEKEEKYEAGEEENKT